MPLRPFSQPNTASGPHSPRWRFRVKCCDTGVLKGSDTWGLKCFDTGVLRS